MRKYLVVLLITALLSFAGCGGGGSSNIDDGGDDGGQQPEVVALTFNTWADGLITEPDGEQSFTFTATEANMNIFVKFGSLTNINVQLYDSDNNKVGDETTLSGSDSSVWLTSLTVGNQYTLKVTPYSSPDDPDDTYSGTFQIAFNTSSNAPLTTLPADAAELTVNLWADGNLEPNDSQWFKFNAASDRSYIYVSFETLSSVYLQVYDSGGRILGIYSTNPASFATTVGNSYYIKVLPDFDLGSSYSGTYRIAASSTSDAPIITPPSNATQLNFNSWTNVNITTPGGAKWFKFTANADTQYIHAIYGTLINLNAQLYTLKDAIGTTFDFNNPPVSKALKTDQEYYLKVWPDNYKDKGTYQIAFNASANAPAVTLPSSATALIEDTPAEGVITAPGGSQWFKFTATAATQYIHAGFGSLTNMYVQLYNNKGSAISLNTLNTANKSALLTSIIVGQEYYLKITPTVSKVTPSVPSVSTDSGTYKIKFSQKNTAILPADAAALAAGTFADGNIPASDGEQWFKFTATVDGNQYIHTSFDTLTSLIVQVYDSDGAAVGSQANISSTSTNKYTNRTVTKDQVYYINVTPASGKGAYKIAFNESTTPPSLEIDAITLNANTWADGNIPTSGGEQWFKFTATVDGSQYIHASFGTLTDLYVQITDSNGVTIGNNQTNLYGSTTNTSRTVISGNDYYIKVWPYNSNYKGTYKIGFTESTTPPPITLPDNAVTLTANTFADGNITATNSEQWFKFTATSSAQFILADFGTLSSIYAQVYDSSGATVGSRTNLTGSSKFTGRALTVDQVYYIRVTPYNSSSTGTYKIAFSTAPFVGSATTLTAGTWASGNLPSYDSEQWFKFTATAATQYIHARFGTLLDLYVQVYNTSGTSVVSSQNLTSTSLIIDGKQNFSAMYTANQDYYIRVTPYSTRKGDYSIAFSESSAAPE